MDGVRGCASPWGSLKGQLILGTEACVSSAQESIGRKEEIPEIPRLQRHVGRPGLERLFPAGEVRSKGERNTAIVEAHLKHGYSLKEIGDHLEIHYTSVSKIIKTGLPKK